MHDPTQPALALGLILSLTYFASACLMRAATNRKASPRPGPEDAEAAGRPVADGGETPYHPPGMAELPPPVPTGRVPVWFYHPLDLLGVGFVLFLFCGTILLGSGQSGAEARSLGAEDIAFSIVFQFVTAFIIICLMFWRVSIAEWLGLRWKGWQWVLLIAPATVALMWVVFAVLQYSGYMRWMDSLGVETVQDTVKLLKDCEDPLALGLMAFAAVVAAPLCEEVVFRGYLYPVMKRFSGPLAAGLVSSFVFAAAHGNLTALLPLFLLGWLFTLIYEKTGSIWAPIGMHLCFNGSTVAIQLLARAYQIPIDSNL